VFDTKYKKGYIYAVVFQTKWGMRWRSWFRHCATSRKVAGAILDDVIGIFHWYNPSGRTMALGSTQLLTKGGRCLGLTVRFSFAECLDVWGPQPPGTLWACNRAVRRLLYLPFQIEYNVCLPKILSLLYEYFEILCGLC